ncbi:MAG: TPM domain-containing protein [Phycisphaerales bacterium]
MKSNSKRLGRGELDQIEAAIERAESRTSAELVVVLASQSGRYDRAEDLFGILLAVAVTGAVWVFGQDLRPDWGGEFELAIGLAPLLLVFGVTFIVGVWIATRNPFLARPFIPAAQMRDEMQRSASEAFMTRRIRATAHSNGLLIYISLFERLVWIVGDDAIAHAFEPATWDAARDRIIKGFKDGSPADAIAEAIDQVAESLALKFPRSADDANEIPNTVHLAN